MGRVLLAFHTGLAQRVAVKLLHAELAKRDETATERFKREARTSARIRHQHVCRVLDAGTLADGTPYLAMEYLEGKDLGEELVLRGRFPVAEAVLLVRQACEGAHEAHRLGIVHRDLKPQNLFLAHGEDGDTQVKVLDFGISKAHFEEAAGKLTRTSSLVGSPLYMSPEQLHADKSLDARADIWALGCILYELIAGRPPFVGESMPQLVHAVLHQEPPTFASLGITVPGGFEPIVSKALHKDRDHRFGSARELADALLPYAPASATLASGPRARTPEPHVAPQADVSGQSSAVVSDAGARTPAPEPARAIRAPNALRWAALGFFAVFGALALAVFARKGGNEPAHTDGAAPTSTAASAVDASSVPAPPVPTPTPAVALSAEPTPPVVAEPELAAAIAPAAPDAGVELAKPSSEKPRTWTPRPWTRPATNTAAPTHPPPVAAPAVAAEPAPPPADKPSHGLPSFGGRR